MILCTFECGDLEDIERIAIGMVETSMASRSSVCSVVGGIPLVTYPNDRRDSKERVKNLVLAFADGWMRSQMENDSIQEIDSRFDPQFECQICKIGEQRERVLGEALAALAGLARRKLPGDDEISALATASDLILKSARDQGAMVKNLGEMLKS